MLGSQATFENRIALRLAGVSAQEVPDGKVTSLVHASGLADVQVIRARALRWESEEVKVGRLRRWDEQIPQPLQRLDVPRPSGDGGDRELEVENGLCGETRYRRRANVIEAGDDCAESTIDPPKLALGQGHPGAVVIDDQHRWIEAVIEGRVPFKRLLVAGLV